MISLCIELHTNDFVAVIELHADDSHRRTSHAADIGFREADTLTVFCYQENIFLVVGQLDFDQFIIFTQADGCKSCLSYVCIIQKRCLFHNTLSGCHKQIFALLVLFDRDHRRDLFFRCELEQIDDRRSSCRTAGFRDFISFQAVYFSGVGKEHQIVMCIHHQQFFDVVIFDGLHTLDALATAVLSLEIVNTHTFNITKFCHGDHNIFTRDQIFCRNIIHIKSNGSSSLITILICDFHDLCFDHAKQKIFVCQNGSQLLDLCHQSFILCFDLLSFQTGQCTQTHIYDRLCLCIGKFKTCHQCFFCKCCCSGCTDNADDFINMIQCDQQTF